MKDLRMNFVFDRHHDQGFKEGVGLPGQIRDFYGSDLVLVPAFPDRSVVSTNFVVRRDGIVNVPEKPGGLTISGGSPEDVAMMAVLRASHDGVLVGSETLAAEPEHLWTARYIFPDFGSLLELWRREKKGHLNPYNIIMSRSGEVRSKEDPTKKVPLTFDYPVFNTPDIRSVIVTTMHGLAVMKESLGKHDVHILTVAEEGFELNVLQALKRKLGIDHLLVEGGPTVNAAFHVKKLVTDDFLTLAPGVIGATHGSNRKHLVEGAQYPAEAIPLPELVSLRWAGNHIFTRERYESM